VFTRIGRVVFCRVEKGVFELNENESRPGGYDLGCVVVDKEGGESVPNKEQVIVRLDDESTRIEHPEDGMVWFEDRFADDKEFGLGGGVVVGVIVGGKVVVVLVLEFDVTNVHDQCEGVEGKKGGRETITADFGCLLEERSVQGKFDDV
jgi:hypothetical protein